MVLATKQVTHLECLMSKYLHLETVKGPKQLTVKHGKQ